MVEQFVQKRENRCYIHGIAVFVKGLLNFHANLFKVILSFSVQKTEGDIQVVQRMFKLKDSNKFALESRISYHASGVFIEKKVWNRMISDV